MSQQQRQIMTLAPQLRQSLEMLQMPVLELRSAIIKEMEQNPTIEDFDDPSESLLSEVMPDPPESHPTDEGLDFNPDVDAILAHDDHWRDYFLAGMENAPSHEDAEERRQYMFDSIREHTSLQDHLLYQLTLTTLSPEDYEIAVTLIGNINDDGYFTGSLPDLIMVTGRSEDEIVTILHRIQTFDPPGIGARDLKESLLLQLEAVEDSPWEDEARILIKNHLDKLALHDTDAMCRTLDLEPHELEQVIELIRSFNPKPGSSFLDDKTEYVTPEVFVKKEEGQYKVKVDDAQLPHIRISRRYRRMLEDPAISADTKSYIRERIRAGAFLIRSLYQRQDTIRKISQAIVDAQTEFFERGVDALRPMTMSEVAQSVGVHETTVSRTVANKYMQTPIGVYELKYFFTTGIISEDGSSLSNRSIQEMIKRIVDAEDPRKPLSDQAIEAELKEQGVSVARRTVAKYRGILKIPPSHHRRRA